MFFFLPILYYTSCSKKKPSLSYGSLSNLIPILYPESFMLFKKGVYNDLSLELYTPFDFQLRI